MVGGEKIEERIERAKELIKIARHATMATVNEDGSPHNSPFYFILDPQLDYVYWGSHPGSLHSKNVYRTGQLFVVVYDMLEKGGLYMQCENGHELSGSELEEGLTIHNSKRRSEGLDPLPIDYYQNPDSPQRMYRATIEHLWVNSAERNDEMRVIRDYRFEIQKEHLL